MKRHGNIYAKIYSMENLKEAHRNARKDKLFYKEVKMVDSDPDHYLGLIHRMLKDKTYKVSEYTISVINDKGKERELAKLPYFPDRIIQWAIMLQIEPIFMEVFCDHTCASIENRGISHAQKLLNKYLKDEKNTQFCLKMDISKFYPNVDHDILKELLKRKFKDTDLLNLLFQIIDSSPHEKGVPIGSYLSQYLANFYLAYFDHWIKEVLGVKYVVRYMDDIIILHESSEFLHKVKNMMDDYLEHNLKLKIKDNWQIFPVESRGIDFVGFRKFHNFTLLRKKTAKRFKRRMVRIWKKTKGGNLMNYSEWCSVNSYRGWLNLCDGFRLYTKYILPLEDAVLRYYKLVIESRKVKVKMA